jgi:hypothetical protein
VQCSGWNIRSNVPAGTHLTFYSDHCGKRGNLGKPLSSYRWMAANYWRG